MPLFFARLISRRPDFVATMTEAERATMQAHAAYLQDLLRSGHLVVAGPVMDPNGPYGMAVFEADSMEGIQAILARDPAGQVGHYEVLPMASGIYRHK